MAEHGETKYCPTITVVVPVYNVEKYLETCVDSICAQTFQDIEILLVDDGSTDNSGELCDKLREKDNRIRVIHKKNGGLSDARNAGIAAAKGDYIGLVDSDDYIAPDMYELLYCNLLREQADVSACTHILCFKDKQDCTSKRGCEVMSGLDFIGISLKGQDMTISSCIKLYKKEILMQTPFTVGRQYEDALLLGQLYQKVDKVVVDYSPKYYYVRHADTITTNAYSSRKLDNIYAFENNLAVVQKFCPQYSDVAWYRVFRAYYEVFDSIIQSDNADARKDKAGVKKFIRGHLFQILRNPYIVSTRKMAVVLSLTSEAMYKQFLQKKMNNRKYI